MKPNAPDEQSIAINYQQQIRNSLWSLLFLATVGAMYFARDFLLPVILASYIAVTLKPAIRYLKRQGVPTGLVVGAIIVTMTTFFLLLTYILSGPIAFWLDHLPQLSQTFSQKFAGVRSSLDMISNISDKLNTTTKPEVATNIQEVVVRSSPLPALLGILTGYPVQILITLLATLVFAVFLMASGDLFYEKMVRILPTLTQRKRALTIALAIENEVSHYVLTLSLINLFVGALIATAFFFLGMPLPYVWGLLAFAFNFVPYVGTLTGVVLSGFMAIVTFDSLGFALIIPLVYALIAFAESELIRPQILGRQLQMNSVAILLSLAFFAWLWGIAGAAMAVPLLLCLKVLCEHFTGLAGLGEFIASARTSEKDAVVAQA